MQLPELLKPVYITIWRSFINKVAQIPTEKCRARQHIELEHPTSFGKYLWVNDHEKSKQSKSKQFSTSQVKLRAFCNGPVTSDSQQWADRLVLDYIVCIVLQCAAFEQGRKKKSKLFIRLVTGLSHPGFIQKWTWSGLLFLTVKFKILNC